MVTVIVFQIQQKKRKKKERSKLYMNKKTRKLISGLIFLLLLLLVFFVCWVGSVNILINNNNKQYRKMLSELRSITPSSDLKNKMSNVVMFYINMDRSMERRREIENFIQKHHLEKNIVRFPAVDGSQYTSNSELTGANSLSTEFCFDVKKYPPGVVGCFLSHILAVKKAHDLGLPYVVIAEDDVVLDTMKLWRYPLYEYLEKAPVDWEWLRFFEFSKQFHSPFLVPLLDSNAMIFKKNSRHYEGTQVYALSRAGMVTVLASVGIYDNNTNSITVHEQNGVLAVDLYYHYLFENRGAFITPSLFVVDNLQHKSTLSTKNIMWFSSDDAFNILSCRVLRKMLS